MKYNYSSIGKIFKSSYPFMYLNKSRGEENSEILLAEIDKKLNNLIHYNEGLVKNKISSFNPFYWNESVLLFKDLFVKIMYEEINRDLIRLTFITENYNFLETESFKEEEEIQINNYNDIWSIIKDGIDFIKDKDEMIKYINNNLNKYYDFNNKYNSSKFELTYEVFDLSQKKYFSRIFNKSNYRLFLYEDIEKIIDSKYYSLLRKDRLDIINLCYKNFRKKEITGISYEEGINYINLNVNDIIMKSELYAITNTKSYTKINTIMKLSSFFKKYFYKENIGIRDTYKLDSHNQGFIILFGENIGTFFLNIAPYFYTDNIIVEVSVPIYIVNVNNGNIMRDFSSMLISNNNNLNKMSAEQKYIYDMMRCYKLVKESKKYYIYMDIGDKILKAEIKYKGKSLDEVDDINISESFDIFNVFNMKVNRRSCVYNMINRLVSNYNVGDVNG